MRRAITISALVFFILNWCAPTRAYKLQYADSAALIRIKWPTNTIKVALSSSLNAPPSNIKPGSDVVGAVRRALAHWSEAVNIEFIETTSTALNVSPSGKGDGLSLITVADTPENRSIFDSADRTGRTRIFYDPVTGAITEADVVINPAAQFSTDGTAGTYDLEATFTHEFGHLLGLEHSDEAGAAMQPRQAVNGLYEQPAFSARTLSEDDLAGARALYGVRENFGIIAGTINGTASQPLSAAHIWIEESATGRVVAGNEGLPNGSYRIEGLRPGDYRLVTDDGAQSQFSVAAGETVRRDITLAHRSETIKPALFGSNGYLSTVAVPLVQGRSYQIFVGGEGLNQVKDGGISIESPFIKVKPASLTLASGVNYEYPIISFEVEISPDAPVGDYSIRLQSKSGEVAYVPGGLTVDSANGARVSGVAAPSSRAAADRLGLLSRLLAPFLGG